MALVAAGVTYLVNKQTDADSTAATMPNAAAAEASSASLASEDGYEAEEPAAVMGDYRKKDMAGSCEPLARQRLKTGSRRSIRYCLMKSPDEHGVPLTS